jgi:4-hydroxybenzoyl-CoA thioesterase
MLYRRPYPIEFNHCDPAGIVFYPRYFEMTHHVCENFFREAVGLSYAQMMADRAGVPTVRLETDFRAPSRLGEVLDVTLEVTRLGTSSVTFEIVGSCGGQVRLTVAITLVWAKDVNGVIGPQPWPEPMRAKLQTYLRAA